MSTLTLLLSSTEMNRHHYSLYVHNCRLVLLLRQDPSEAENYKPAEFHWKLDQVSQQRCFQDFFLLHIYVLCTLTYKLKFYRLIMNRILCSICKATQI